MVGYMGVAPQELHQFGRINSLKWHFVAIGGLHMTSSKNMTTQIMINFSLRTCEANPVGENSSFISTVCVKSVPLDHFELAYIVLHMAVKEFFETHF